MKKALAIKLAGGVAALAKLLGVTSSAISQWADDIPDARVWQLKALRPEWFTNPALIDLASEKAGA